MVPLHLVQEFDDLDVWCRCKGCREWKPVAHYLSLPGGTEGSGDQRRPRGPYGSWRECVVCRRQTPRAEWEKGVVNTGRECLICGGALHNGGNSGRVCCRRCWQQFAKDHPGQVTRMDVLGMLFDRHWLSLDLLPGQCADCGRPLRSMPYLWRPGMRCQSCTRRGNKHALRSDRKLSAA